MEEQNINEKIAKVEEIVGRLTTHVHPLLAAALEEDEQGVYDLALVVAAESGIKSPGGLLIYRIQRGHHKPPREIEQAPSKNLPTLEEVERRRELSAKWWLVSDKLGAFGSPVDRSLKQMDEELKRAGFDKQRRMELLIYAMEHPNE